jgi:phosphatidate cytidylyltransferase
MNNTIIRTISAMVMLSIALIAMFFKGWEILIILMIAIGIFEFLSLNNIKSTIAKIAIVALLLIIFPYILVISIFALPVGLALIILVGLFWLKNIFLVVFYPRYPPKINTFFAIINSIWYFLPTAVALIFLNNENQNYLILLLLIVWGADSFAYFAGRAFGKNKLAPKVSAGKTLEGALGGIFGVVIVTLIWMYLTNNSNWMFILIAIIAAIFSIVGDLFESIYKREAKVKDSGSILPGHGGVLDRIDGLLAATPIFMMLVIFLL